MDEFMDPSLPWAGQDDMVLTVERRLLDSIGKNFSQLIRV